jgi:hypothetical protein
VVGDGVHRSLRVGTQRREVGPVQLEPLFELPLDAVVHPHVVRLAQGLPAEQEGGQEWHQRHGRDGGEDLSFEARQVHQGT